MSAPSVRPSGRLRRTATRAWASDRLLALLVALMGPTLAVCAIGLAVDPNVITGAPAWLKPAKFSVSIAIYGATLLWLLTLIDGHRRLVRTIGAVTALALGIEQAIIVGAVVLDTTSHFNVSTPAQTAAWSTMGASIVLVWVMNLLAMILLLRQRLVNRAFAWSLRLGLVASCVGMAVAFLMTTPTTEQLAAAEAGRGILVAGAHSVGVADGGPGLPIVGWSTVGGDLRAAHFVGLHGLQVLPLVGWLLVLMRVRWLDEGHRSALVIIAGLSYIAVVTALTWQALRGQPLIAPDAWTLAALGAIVAAAGAAGVGVVAHARRRPAG
ncbi:MAG: hypothetical protein H0T96_07685 [Thermoleophilaceae bacterium]|jgi:hypothetical protein|nr:hypothetical protein [Thermoleophilaceae bacterium]